MAGQDDTGRRDCDAGAAGWPTWLCGTAAAVHELFDSAETAAELGSGLPDALTAVPGVRFAWIALPRRDDIRVRAVPGGVDAPPTLPSDGETLTERTVATGELQVRAEAPADAGSLLDSTRTSPADVDSFFGVPLRGDDTSFGVLHLYVAGDPTGRELLTSLGPSVGRQLQAFETAEQLERERGRLESTRSLLSHDLGNPLNIASGRVELARADDDTAHLDSVDAALEQVDDLLDRGVRLVEVGQQPVETEWLSLAVLARDSWDDVGQDRGELTVEDATLSGERERVRMLLNELYRNALDHGEGPTTVDIGPLSDTQGFYVADDGPGIPAEEREYVFDAGYTTKPDREGLGLAVVTEIAGAHGWDVALEQSEPGGTRVEVVTGRW